MFEYVFEWIQNIAFYLIIVTAVLHIIPNESYKNYIRFFTGLILIVLFVQPILNITGSLADFEKIYANQEYKQIEKELSDAKEYFKEKQEEYNNLELEFIEYEPNEEVGESQFGTDKKMDE